jgi:hypothetical protein
MLNLHIIEAKIQFGVILTHQVWSIAFIVADDWGASSKGQNHVNRDLYGRNFSQIHGFATCYSHHNHIM